MLTCMEYVVFKFLCWCFQGRPGDDGRPGSAGFPVSIKITTFLRNIFLRAAPLLFELNACISFYFTLARVGYEQSLLCGKVEKKKGKKLILVHMCAAQNPVNSGSWTKWSNSVLNHTSDCKIAWTQAGFWFFEIPQSFCYGYYYQLCDWWIGLSRLSMIGCSNCPITGIW